MKIKAMETKLMYEGLDGILQLKIPTKPAYWLSRFLSKILPEFQAFDKIRVQLVDKYSTKDEEGKVVYIKDKEGKDTKEPDIKDREGLEEEFRILGEQEFEINFKPIKLDDLICDVCDKCGKEKNEIPGLILFKLGKIIEI